jgi:hypothetical protein
VIRLNPTFPKGVGGFYSPSGEFVVREGGSYHLGACVGAVSGGAACGSARFYAVDKEEIVQPLMDSVQVELC